MSATAEDNARGAKPAGNFARTVSQRKRKRLFLIGGALAVLAVAVGLMLMAFSQDIRFFRTPADLTEQDMASGSRFRLGGLVEEGSVSREGSELRYYSDRYDQDREGRVRGYSARSLPRRTGRCRRRALRRRWRVPRR